MAGLYLFMSNRLERLAEALAHVLSSPLASPFHKEIIVVQSRGMERWLRMELAVRHGICANVEFPFPNALMKLIFSWIAPDLSPDTGYDKDVLIWRVMKVLPGLISRAEFKEIREYLGSAPDEDKLFELCRYVASCLDQYLIYRPEMILRWEAGRGKHWQAMLWRQITAGKKTLHWASARELLRKRLREPDFDSSALASRISVFGISSLPPYHVGVLAEISRFTEVDFFVLNPCREFWFDIVPEKKIVHLLKNDCADTTDLLEKLHLETGNAILASMGYLGRDFISLIMGFDPSEQTFYEDPGRETLLRAIQSDILNLREAGQVNGEPLEFAGSDKSVSIHSCHSPLRELQVLYDNLLEVFEQEPDVRPKDIVVMAPDISIYIPFINAVFGARASGPKAIPYSIADRGYGRFGQIAPTLFHFFELIDSRFTVSQVLSILEREPVRTRYGFSDKDISTLKELVSDTRISWAINEHMKEALGLPATKENTWKAGVERLLLGYALPGEGWNLYKGILPYDEVEGEAAELVGRFALFLSELVSTTNTFSRPASLDTWRDRLNHLLDELLAWNEKSEWEFQILQRIFADLRSCALISGYDRPVSHKVVRSYLDSQLEESGFSGGFLSRGVTFCSLLPMRSIPFKVVCLIGMNHDAYPRQSRKISFDLMAAKPRRGDRFRRNDDRYLFLEAILSARSRLIISYVGQSEADNSAIPPSPLVSELMDYMDRNFVINGRAVREHIVVSHRLHCFSTSYFLPDSRLFTYFDETLAAARCLQKRKEEKWAFFTGALPGLEDIREIPVESLEGFLANPVRQMLRERLGINFKRQAPVPRDEEPVILKGLDGYHVDQKIISAKLRGVGTELLYQVLKAEGVLPHAGVGKVQFEQRDEEGQSFVQSLLDFTEGQQGKCIQIDTSIGGIRIHGNVGEIYPLGLVHYRYGTIRGKDHLKLWLHHLLFNLVGHGGQLCLSYLVGKDSQWEYAPVSDPIYLLGQIVELYIEGMKRPIRLFPESSFAYSNCILNDRNTKVLALMKAQEKWSGTKYIGGECSEDYFRLCFGEENPLDEEFIKTAERIVFPIVKAQRKL